MSGVLNPTHEAKGYLCLAARGSCCMPATALEFSMWEHSEELAPWAHPEASQLITASMAHSLQLVVAISWSLDV